MPDFDVIVVGGGPAGSTAATLCARHGLSVALLEHKRFPRHKVCGDVVNPNCWQVLHRLGVAEKVRALPHHMISAARFCAVNGAVADINCREGMEMRAIRRGLFDACLLEHARANGVAVFEGEAARKILPRWRVATANRMVTTKVLVGADGRHSLVAKKAGLWRNRAYRNGHIALQSHFRATKELNSQVQLHLFPGGYCGIVRVDSDLANLCIVTNRVGARARDDCERLFSQTVWRNPCFRSLGIAPEPLEPLQTAYPLWAAMNLPTNDRVFLVGDALRVMEPFTGQGIFFAIRSAELAARVICAESGAKYVYTDEVTRLYRNRGRTNDILRRLMYHERAARAAVAILDRWPRALRWLSDNVLGEASELG